MQLVWSLIVAWVMVASAAPHGPYDHAHRTGISVAPAFHHPLRQRELPASLGPFVAPDRDAVEIPPAGQTVRSITSSAFILERAESTAHARAPPAA
ncbi:MAG TPA: hypothetical protein VFQ65_13580 [Kofleriaceae bacterium]|nr:hypothetical protein [Kofleriaceae bacterium]